MGTRLYPNTQDTASLEKLAGVAAGTAERLLATQARHAEELKKVDRQFRNDFEYKQWCEIKDDENMGGLDHFLTFGWGKFDGIGLAEDCSGHLTDPDAIARLFAANGITADIALCEGVHWC
jgi:hypothetical protein